MLKNGDVVELPGMKAVMAQAPRDPASDSMEIEITLAPSTLGAPPHHHPGLDEEYRVLSGTFEVLYGKRWRRLPAGESLVIPARTNHTFRNAAAAPATLLNIHRPADGFAAYWERLGDLSRSGKAVSMSDPRTVIRLSMLLTAHPDALVPTGSRGRAMMPAAAWLGRFLKMDPAPAPGSAQSPSS